MSEITKQGKIIKGFKATDGDMKCKGFAFELDKWYEHDGELSLCASGFHFCPHMSGVWVYYPAESRVFEVEAEVVLIDYQPGAGLKYVAKRIRLVKEVEIGGDSNTGNRNTGDRNTGNSNTGYRNTGDSNTGHCNTGDRNTGNSNTGYRNTGDSNTGHCNTGNSNTGDRNTGNSNTGNRNTGHCNTGNRNTGDSNTGHCNTGDDNTGNSNTGYRNTGDFNTGDSNTTDNCAGFFCQNKQKVRCFDVETNLTHEQFNKKHGNLAYDLGFDLARDEPFDYEAYKSLPGWTMRRIKSLHRKHINRRM